MSALHWIYIAVCALMSAITYFVYRYDKMQARKRRRRVPESTLYTLTGLFGSFGAYIAMQTLHHKTRHLSFNVLVPLAMTAHAAIFAILYLKF